ncbi:MAG: ArsA-related P-loop ATPase [Myxococcota bacterium]|nr:ArsA-related P-loop ATPase [Myxococcota bacterium]
MAPDERTSLSPLLSKQRILICVGAGGVGKTTIAASYAVKAARSGRRVVCLTIDPAKRLADSLGVTPDQNGATPKDITHMLGSDRVPSGRLSIGMLDPKETFARLVRLKASSPEAAARILNNKLYRYVSGSLSGMQEYMALEQLAAIRSDPEVELIVLDTPPTANAIDFFTAPRRMTEALDGRLVRVMRRAYSSGPARVGLGIWGRWTATVLRILKRFTGTELLNEMMGFIDALSDLFGSFSDRAQAIEKVLHGDEVAFCLITAPDKATLRETREFRDRLASLGLTVDAIIFNRAHWPRAGDPPDHLDAVLRQEIVRINEHWNKSHDSETPLVERVKKAWDGQEIVIRVPILPSGVTRLAALDHLGHYL